ncbi:MAG: proline dehydrogenase family protein [Deferrisomatales bacterium]
MANTEPLDDAAVDTRVLALGRELLQRMGEAVPGVFDRRRWEGKILDWAMGDPAFKTDLFRFVDVLPALKGTGAVARHAREYLFREGRELPGLPAALSKAAATDAAAFLLARAVRKNVEELARRFIAGRNAGEALAELEALHRQGLAFTVDLLGEATLSDAEAAAYADRYRDLIETLPVEVARWPEDPRIDRTHLGPLPRAQISMKISAMDPHLDPLDPPGCVGRLKERLLPLLTAARQRGASVHLDMEHWEIHEITLALFEELAADPALRDWPHLGIAVQAYLRQAPRDLERLLSVARSRGAPIGVRLVKGAYWDTEVIRARQHGHPCPVFTEKAASDAQFEALSAELLREPRWFQPAFASHNLRSLAHAAVVAEQLGVPKEAVEFQTLHGMAEPERRAFRDLGYRVRVYVPVGELLPGMAYLVRRLLENTSNEGFLRLTHREHADPEALFARPRPSGPAPSAPHRGAPGEGPSAPPFANCPHADFTSAEVRRAFADAVEAARRRLPVEVPVHVAGKKRAGGRTLHHPCPSHSDLTAAVVTLGEPEDVERAAAAAWKAWPSWRDRPVEERAALLEALAARLEQDRYALAALQVWEVAKPWREADADVTEAIDFCRYYARQAREELAARPLGAVPGEANRVLWEGRGPAAVIAPWNFPLAILTGMSTAALVAGNPVILKPAEQSSAVGWALFEHLVAAGFPPGVVQFLPGLGEEVGARLAADPRVALVAFTGSKAVGLALWEQAARTPPGQRHLKKVVCEMGGKNAVIVDDDADLDAAVAGVMTSAFGYAGQKCSACSRVLTVGAAHEPFVARLVEACRSLPVTAAEEPACRLGPVIDREACERLWRAAERPGEGAQPLFLGTAPSGGWYVPAAVFEVADPRHRLMQEELFGPVLAVHRVKDFDRALEVAVATDYALTGAVYSRSPTHLESARRRFRVGNLYLNRGCTGAMVGRQPFGGFALSGAGTQAGGPGYLLHFAQPRCVCENTVRRGFSPDVQI